MANDVIGDRIKETSTTTGTTDYALGGAASGFLAFSDYCANGDAVMYEAEMGTDWETGIGTWATGPTLQRTTILKSTNGGSKVSWGAGSKTIRGVLIGDKATARRFLGVPLVQIVSTETGAEQHGTNTVPIDDTIPQQGSPGEGFEVMTLAITPKFATSKLQIDVVTVLSHHTVALCTLVAMLFQDSTASALAAYFFGQNSVDTPNIVSFRHTMTSGTTSSTTFKVRVGSGSAGTVTFNGAASARYMGGVLASSITITEYIP